MYGLFVCFFLIFYIISLCDILIFLQNPPGTNSVIMKTTDNERYECILPQEKQENNNDIVNYPGPSPQTLIEGIFKKKICTVRVSYTLIDSMKVRFQS